MVERYNAGSSFTYEHPHGQFVCFMDYEAERARADNLEKRLADALDLLQRLEDPLRSCSASAVRDFLYPPPEPEEKG